ncbi:nucleoid-structuring protein H-NS [Mycobacterium mantenii]|uniref:Nucleoid-structuring protein H-NS n=2 Tax=Mycobacterium mantenii TaxID=560555 RepID=A0A1X0FX69_MYCNT|nr:hypothetical protein BST30_10345 [Mycobacterium mantenii]BBY36509.1 nucleoid-structuring protein H-NS [Mycobacterium mantenii]
MLKERRSEVVRMLATRLEEARSVGRQNINQAEAAMLREKKKLDARIKRAESELKRSDTSSLNPIREKVSQRNGTASTRSVDASAQPGLPRGARPINTAGRLAPLGFSDQQLQRMQAAAQRGENCRIETEKRDFSTADPLLPATRFPYPVEQIHEARLLDRLPGYAIETPAVTFIRHISTTGSPAAVAEGALKPELTFNTDALTATAVKLAANNGLSWEIINDWPAFQSYANVELYRQIVDLENSLLISGNSGIAVYSGAYQYESQTGMQGFLDTPGILKYDASVDTGGSGSTLLSALDSFEKAIATLRVGPALATPDLIVLHPTTWSAIRRIKDAYGHFMVQPDPTAGQANQLWGIDVLTTTAAPEGEAVLIDTSKFGYVAIREPLSMRIGYATDDFTRNILRTVAEERLVLCVTRPPAVLQVYNLATTP